MTEETRNIAEEVKPQFEQELQSLINRFSKENGSNTPDFILAEYLNNSLENFNQTSRKRERWYGKELSILAPRTYTQQELSELQSAVHAITGDGEVMALFNKLQGISGA